MKLVLIITDYGSFNNFLCELALEMLENQNEVHLITSNVKIINRSDKFNFKSTGLKIHYVNFPRNFNPFSHFKASKEIKKKLKEIQPDLVHVHFTTGIFTTVFSGRLKYRTIGTIHGLGYPVLEGFKKKIFKFVEEFCFKRLDEVWLLNKSDYEIAKKKSKGNFFLYKSKGLGCDLKKNNPLKFDSTEKTIIKKELGIKKDDFVFAFIGRYVSFKGYHLVINAFLKILEEYPKTKLITMGGEDPIHPTGLSENIKVKIRNDKNIINIGFTGEIERYLSITDLFVFPSFKEGMPVCVIESLSMGVPVVTTDSRGCNDLIQNNYNGFLIKDRNSLSELIELLKSILNDTSILNELKTNIIKDRPMYSRNLFIKEQMNYYLKK